MPIYTWKNGKGRILEVYRTVSKRGVPPTRDEGAGRGNYVRVVEGVHSTQQEWSKPVYSDSMGINAEDVRAHQIAHPSIPILADGRIGPITNHHQHLAIQKELGFINRSG